ncbi:MAG: hypothetical protein A3C58_01625 [Candidatus Staskawiczbacteria bacterium RIFCSPHIGHO2_02_FULL_34_10]|uniref:Uncharacterized protein n=1 Tax=Candidatus Staskawiczbacteria bacterium RIFCSPHIGHO2_02_FULL_34_10 TaxID=1802205 RepID=A0A1G2HVJ2_9BACT|nr:MAG: hypothetical protein A3C58_01625 [Candidatus Staskawiczbacteria bacterium RIFCSPHIGHO2_02_FULL_34_10]
MKLQQKIQAIDLRKSGRSYGEIRREIKVSKATLSLWLRDIVLTPEQEDRIYVELKQKNAYRMAKANQRKRIEGTEEIIKKAKKEAVKLFKNPLFLPGLMLYWAEGDKSELHEHVKFTNADPRMIKFIMRWFREICKIQEERFRVCIHIHSLHVKKDIENYWSGVTGIPISQFHKTQIKQTSLGQRKNKIYEGTCAISTGNKNLFRKIKGWKIGFMEKMNITE